MAVMNRKPGKPRRRKPTRVLLTNHTRQFLERMDKNPHLRVIWNPGQQAKIVDVKTMRVCGYAHPSTVSFAIARKRLPQNRLTGTAVDRFKWNTHGH